MLCRATWGSTRFDHDAEGTGGKYGLELHYCVICGKGKAEQRRKTEKDWLAKIISVGSEL